MDARGGGVGGGRGGGEGGGGGGGGGWGVGGGGVRGGGGGESWGGGGLRAKRRRRLPGECWWRSMRRSIWSWRILSASWASVRVEVSRKWSANFCRWVVMGSGMRV